MGHNFLLVHGSWHDEHCWAEVRDCLAAGGHSTRAPTLAGHGAAGNRAASHADCVRSVVEIIVADDLTDIVLVGHSFGGTVIQAVAEEVPDRIRRLVFQNAFVLEDGESLTDVIPLAYAELFEATTAPDGGVTLPYPIFREAFMNDATDSRARHVYETLSPTPRRSQTDKVRLPRFAGLAIPKSYINCTDDTALPPGPEFGWHPRHSSRLGLHRLVQIAGSHEVMFTNPAALANAIVNAGQD